MLDKESKSLEVTLRASLECLKWLVFYGVFNYGFCFLIFGKDLFSIKSSLFVLIHSYYSIQVALTLYVYLLYFFENRQSKYLIKENGLIDFKLKREIPFSDIDKMVIRKSLSMTAGRIPYFSYQYYRYCELMLKNGEVIVLTNLLNYKIDDLLKKYLKDISIEERLSPFNFMMIDKE